jgi:phage protein D/phage baseplate assembly protein gpV
VAEERRLAQAVITLDGARLPAEMYELLSLIRVEESVQLPDAFVLRFADPHFELFDQMKFRIGTKLDIALSGEGDPVTVTRGEVTALSVEQGTGGAHELVVSGLDVTHRLVRAPKTKSFLNMTDADIASQIAAEHGFDTDIDPTSEVHDYVLQSSQSDYAFLRVRADRIGYDLWVADGKLHFKKKPKAAVTPPVLRWGANLHKFRVRFASAERADEVTVRGWDPVKKAAIVGRATEGDLGTVASAAGELRDAARSAFGQISRFAGQFPIYNQAEADALAQSLMLKASGDEVVVRGEATGDPLIAAGADVDVQQVGTKLSGTYRITSVEHVYGAGTPYVTRFVCGGKDPAGVTDLLMGSGNGSGEKRGWGSLVIGIVTNNDDPMKHARVKVKFPSLSDTDESNWAKVAAPGGGKDRGFQCIPEVGDEVLVGFEHDDKRRPIVIGGLWNSSDPPPEDVVKGGEVKTRAWVSRKRHVILLRDEDWQGGVTVSTSDPETSLTLVDDGNVALKGTEEVQVTARKILVKAGQELVLEGTNVSIKASGQVSIKGSQVGIN